MTRYDYKAPRTFNWVSIGMILLLLGGAYAAWKFIPVYYRNYKVDEALTDYAFRAIDTRNISDLQLRNTAQTELEGQAHDKLVELGINDPDLNVYFDPDLSHLHADYRVLVSHPFGKTTTLDFQRTIKVPGDSRAP